MSLRLIVAALGGDIHSGGRSANVPAPGHSRADRSVSLLLDGDRVVIHGFGAADWRAVREHLQGLGFIDPWGRLNSQGVQPRLRGGDPAFPCARHPSDGGRRYPSLQRRQRSCCRRHRKGPILSYTGRVQGDQMSHPDCRGHGLAASARAGGSCGRLGPKRTPLAYLDVRGHRDGRRVRRGVGPYDPRFSVGAALAIARALVARRDLILIKSGCFSERCTP